MRYILLVATLFIISAIGIVSAQAPNCPAIVEASLNSVDNLCNAMDRNSACYGANDVESQTILDPRPADFFIAPGDRADLLQLKEIRPLPLNPATESFGVGVLNVQANIPNTIPGQAVILLMMGDARLTNEGSPTVPDAAPFESFYFLPGISDPECYEAEPILTIQTPGTISVTIALNGIETEMSPGTLLTLTADVCTIHRGGIIRRSGDNEAILLANETVDTFIDEDTGAIVVTNKRGISEREFARGLLIQDTLNQVATANDWPEQYIVPPRQFAEELSQETLDDLIAQAQAPADSDETSEADAPCETQHTVTADENLHRIATAYDTSVLSIAEANNLENPRVIYPGQVLCIPEPDSGFEPLPAGF